MSIAFTEDTPGWPFDDDEMDAMLDTIALSLEALKRFDREEAEDE